MNKYLADPTNFTVGRNSKITEITIHHMAGVMSAEQCGNVFKRPNRGGSSTYGIGVNGEIGLYVEEGNTPWTNSNFQANSRAITIECSNSQVDGNWPISDATLNSLIKLVADISTRHGIALIKGNTLTWHRMYTATTCPGEYILSKMDYIIQESNKLKGVAPTPAPKSISCRAHLLGGAYLETVYKADGTPDGFAGVYGKPIDGIQIWGVTSYRVKYLGGNWEAWVNKTDDTSDGYAGTYGRHIEGIQVEGCSGYQACSNGVWNPPVYKVDNTDDGFAGVYGKAIDGFKVW